MKSPLHIVTLVDWAEIPDDDPEFRKPGKHPTATEYHVIAALRELGHQVTVVGAHDDARELVGALVAAQPQLVFNITEQFRGEREQDKNIAALLELMGIPFTGTGSTGLMLCRDKGLTKQLLGHHRVKVPGFAVFRRGARVHVARALQYPLVVKPAFSDGSEGIANASLVSNEEALRERVQFIHDHWKQAAIAEEYIDGRELYVGLLGNRRLQVLPPRELFFNREGNGPVLATYRVKWDEAYQAKWGLKFEFGELDEATSQRVAKVCKRVYRIMQLQDFGRIDLRLTPDGQIVILEANPNPDIAYGDEVAEAAEKAGIAYTALIDQIVRLALRRARQA